MSVVESVYQRHAVRFNPQNQTEMRPTFQNIDCFKHETGSIIGKLSVSTVNPEKMFAYNCSL